MQKKKKSHMEPSHSRNLLDLHSRDVKAICGYHSVLIACRSVRRELEAIIDWRFDGRWGAFHRDRRANYWSSLAPKIFIRNL